jgi:ribonuclease BN (tRNA processing enzyme)
MKITSLGHGGAFAGMDKGNTSFLLEEDGGKLLIDCGTLTPYILRDEMKIDFHDIDTIAITHNHADHVGGLPLFLQSRFWIPKIGSCTPILRVPNDVWSELEISLDNEVRGFLKDSPIGIHNFANSCTEFSSNYARESFVWRGIRFNFIPTTHVKTGRFQDKPCYSIAATINGKRILWTGDTNVVAKLEDYDIVFHDCETGNFKTGVHCHYEDIKKYIFRKKIKSDRPFTTKVYAVHYTNHIDGEDDILFFQKESSILI